VGHEAEKSLEQEGEIDAKQIASEVILGAGKSEADIR
jgi:hypothetical protein